MFGQDRPPGTRWTDQRIAGRWFRGGALRRLSRVWLLLLCATMISACSLPTLEGRSQSHALDRAESMSTQLGRGLAEQTASHPGQTGILPLVDAQGAFAARMRLAQAAQKTLDVQYYIWRNDVTGTLLLDALYQAAERGVRVRLLLDDNGTAGLDDTLATLAKHPNIEIRLFNPFAVRSPKALGYVTNFGRANRRMHNKSFTADNQATIVGGRNVGDEYFGASQGVLFADLDVLAVGAVVPDVSDDFDRYWASDSAYPVQRLLPPKTDEDLRAFASKASEKTHDPQADTYLAALHASKAVSEMVNGHPIFQWSKVSMVSDAPRKGLGLASDEELVIFRLKRVLGTPTSQVDLVSPYFVPTAAGVDAFTQLAANGVKIRVLTNALEATDVVAVHAGYAKRRKALLEAGIQLYEMRRQAGGKPKERSGPFGSSGSSLHAKTFSVDRKRVFVGSFNFDPRSARLNTELGFIIENETLAASVQTAFDKRIPADSYEVHLDKDGKLYWIEQENGKAVRLDSEPGTGPLKRLGVGFLTLLPIEWLL